MSSGADDHPVAPPAEGIPLGPPDLIRGGPQRIPRPPDWRPGAPAPWSALPATARRPTLAMVRDAFRGWAGSSFTPAQADLLDELERASAVLAAIYEHHGEPHVLLTRRSWSLRAHRGEVSFPGGRSEPQDDDLVTTALRETFEEVGIAPDAVEVIGQLHPLSTVSSRSFIAPFVGILPGVPEVDPDPREVEEVRHVALSELMSPEVYREEIWLREGSERSLYFFELHGDTVWGATASMLHDLLCRITGADPGAQTRHRGA